MTRTKDEFKVQLIVPLKSLDTFVGLAKDLECKFTVLQWQATPISPPKPPSPAPPRPASSLKEKAELKEKAKEAIVDILRAKKRGVRRSALVKELKSKGIVIKKNSIGPLLTEMKRAGLIVNVIRIGFWGLAPGVS